MIILTILGIIGKIILIILGIVLFLILTVLLYPILYGISGESDRDRLCFEGSVSWLFNIIGIKIKYDNGFLSKDIRFLFFHLKDKENEKDDTIENEETEESHVEENDTQILMNDNKDIESEDSINEIEESAPDEDVENSDVIETKDQIESDINDNNKGVISELKDLKKSDDLGENIENKDSLELNGTANEKSSEEKRSGEKNSKENESGEDDPNGENGTSKLEDIKKIFSKKQGDKKPKKAKDKNSKNKNSKEKTSKVKNILEKFDEFRNDPQMTGAVSHLKNEFVHFLKVILPDKLKMNMQFSLGEPDYTGILLGILAVFPTGYKNRWKLVPDFESEKAYAVGKWRLSGSFSLISFVLIFLRIILDKNCRKLYNKYIK